MGPVKVSRGRYVVSLQVTNDAGRGAPDHRHPDDHENHQEAAKASLAGLFARSYNVGIAEYARRPECRQFHNSSSR